MATTKRPTKRQAPKPRPKSRLQKKLNTLENIEKITAKDLEAKRRKKRNARGEMQAHSGRKRRNKYEPKKIKRKPRPEGKTADEIKEMDPDDPSFKYPQGRPRKVKKGESTSDLDWKAAARRDKQDRMNGRRAKVRKREAVEAAVIEENPDIRVDKGDKQLGVAPVDEGYQVQALDMDEWDEEELARGYRKNRLGRFGPPPKFIPREVQVESFRRIVKQGEHELQGIYLEAMRGLARLATAATSEKVQLEAIKEIQDRLVGRVPEHLRVGPDAPWQEFLADSMLPVSELPALEMGSPDEDGVVHALSAIDEGVDDAPANAPPRTAAAEAVVDAPAPSSSSKEAPAKRRRKKKTE